MANKAFISYLELCNTSTKIDDYVTKRKMVMKKFIVLSLIVGLGIAHTGLNANFLDDMRRFHRELKI